MNKIHDKVFTCPKCTNKTLYPIDKVGVLGVGYKDVCICEECAAELYVIPKFDGTVEFMEIEE